MRRIAFVMTAMTVGLLLGAGRPEPGVQDKSELVEEESARFQGTWQLVSVEADGVKAPRPGRQDPGGHQRLPPYRDVRRPGCCPLRPVLHRPDDLAEVGDGHARGGPDKGKQIKGITSWRETC